ncbi:MAG TPA: OmpA family protein [Saprospiraceae bacterium]|nr:OmpA family protein [Saprospiraceae bacterium]
MTFKFIVLFSALTAFSGVAIAQEDDPFNAPIISDEMTVDAEQNQQWRLGQSKYPARPKHMWELGINAGHAFISGDVESVAPSGFGVGLSLRRAVNYVLSIRVGVQYTTSKGADARGTSYKTFRAERAFEQNGGDAVFGVYEGQDIHRNYKATTIAGSVEAIVNIGNILFHQARNKWNGYVGFGIGLNAPDVTLNLFDGDSPYDFASVTSGLNLDNLSDRKEARSNLKDLLDDDYETEGGIEKKIAKLGDDRTVLYHFVFSTGLSRKLSKRLNLGIEHQIMWVDSDLWDGYDRQSDVDESTSNDLGHYTSLRLGINLGSFEKSTEPLYWLNPLDAPYSDIAELKQRPKFDLTDSDGDGVIDMIDAEKNTPAGSPVDTRGVTLDSDGDGIPDYKDKERFSPPGYTINSDGVAQVPEYLTEEEVVDLINSRPAAKVDWFLPMVHFDLDKYFVKPEFYGQLHHVATVMKTHPNIRVVAQGYADNRNPDEYNRVLSYNRANEAINFLVSRYGIPRDRFVLMYSGESETLVPDLPDHHSIPRNQEMQHYMNRRVEFSVAGSDDQEMAKPTGPDAGEKSPGSSRPGSKYSGNRNSGYRP